MMEFDHIGIKTTEPQEGESWVEKSQVWVTNPRTHPMRIEYLRSKDAPDVDSSNVGLWKLFHQPHVAYRVDDLDAAIEGEELVYGPFEPGDFGRVAFIHKNGLIVEYLEYSDLSHWFGQPTPWTPSGPPQE